MISVSNLPIGLLSLLDAKSFGEMPREMSSTYLGVIDVWQQIMLNKREYLDSGASVPAVLNTTVLFSTNLTVPQNEFWYVWHFDVQSASMGAGASIRIAPQLHVRTNADITVGGSRGATGAAATEQAIAQADGPFWAPPGSVLAFIAEQLVGAVNVSGHTLLTRLRV